MPAFPSLAARSEKKEIIDERTLAPEEMRSVYRLIGCVNRWLGGYQVLLSHLSRFSRNWDKNKVVSILDVGAGDASIPRAIADWASREGFNVRITALDICPETLKLAGTTLGPSYPGISLLRASAAVLPFADKSFDYVIASMFFHHLPDDVIPGVLRQFDRIARRGIIVNDLLRRRRAYYGIMLAGLLSADPVFRHDSALSVLRGFKEKEVRALIERSGLRYLKVSKHYAHRIAIAGEKHDERL